MDSNRVPKARNGVVVSLVGSVWESRVKIDEVKVGTKVFNGESNPKQQNVDDNSSDGRRNNGLQSYKRMRPKQGVIGISDKNSIQKKLGEQCKEISVSVDRIKKSQIQMKRVKSKSEPIKTVDESGELRKVKSDTDKVNFDLTEGVEGSVEEIEKNPDENLEENVEGFDSCEEKVNTGIVDNVGSDEFGGEDELKEEIDEEIEKQSVGVEEIKIEEEKPNRVVVIEEKKFRSTKETEFQISQKQIPFVVNRPKIVPKSTNTKPIPVTDEFKGFPKTHNKLQSLVDLIMWNDVPKSAFIFGFGTFTLISSSYTNDLNISFISVVSYMGLVYLAAIFLFRSIINRGVDLEEISEEEYIIGEEEAAWLIKLILPYINEFLLNIKFLFSGDPSTTMKLAVLFFILARCGSSITIWKMSKLGFFGVFTIPKICTSYSPQLTAHGTFWVQRFRDAWESCSHKKIVAFGIFALIWNMSSVVARIWTVFMVIVGFKYYKHCMMRDEELVDEEEESCKKKVGGETQKSGPKSTIDEIKRKKKG